MQGHRNPVLSEGSHAWLNALLCLEILCFCTRDPHFHFVLDLVNYVVGPAWRLKPANISLTALRTTPFHIGHDGQMRNPRGKTGNIIYSV